MRLGKSIMKGLAILTLAGTLFSANPEPVQKLSTLEKKLSIPAVQNNLSDKYAVLISGNMDSNSHKNIGDISMAYQISLENGFPKRIFISWTIRERKPHITASMMLLREKIFRQYWDIL